METRRTERLIIEEVNPNEARYAYVHSGCIAYSGDEPVKSTNSGCIAYSGDEPVKPTNSGCIAYSGEGTINLPDMGIGCYIGGTVRGRSRICSEKAMAKRWYRNRSLFPNRY